MAVSNAASVCLRGIGGISRRDAGAQGNGKHEFSLFSASRRLCATIFLMSARKPSSNLMPSYSIEMGR